MLQQQHQQQQHQQQQHQQQQQQQCTDLAINTSKTRCNPGRLNTLATPYS